MGNIKVTKWKKYYQVRLLTDLPYVPMSYNDYTFCSDRKCAETFITAIRVFRNEFERLIIAKGLTHNVDLIMLRYLQTIDSYASGIDIRSKMAPEELAEAFISQYDRKYNEVLNQCQETLKFVENNQNNAEVSYMKDWKRYDEYNSLNRNFYLGLHPISMDSFKGNELKKIGECLDEMKKILFKSEE